MSLLWVNYFKENVEGGKEEQDEEKVMLTLMNITHLQIHK